MPPSTVMRAVWLEASKIGASIWRVNTGVGWVSGGGEVQRRPDGSVVVPYARPVSIGLTLVDGKPAVGTPDLLGFTRVMITPEMVGLTLPVFTGFEVKEGVGRASEDQKKFIEFITRSRGISGVTRSKDDVAALHRQFLLQIGQKLE